VFLTESIRIFCEEAVETEEPALMKEYQTEIQLHKNEIEHQQKQVRELEDKIQSLEQELTDQERTFNEAGNPEYDQQTKLESCITNKLDIFSKKLLNELAVNNKRFEEKVENARLHVRFESFMDEKFNDLKTSLGTRQQDHVSYSDMLKKNTQNDFQTIIRVAKIEECQEERDHNNRKKNIVIHGVHEVGDNDEENQKMRDENFVKSLLTDVANRSNPKYIGRIGLQSPGKFRPIKVAFETEEEKRKLFSHLSALKGLENYESVSITDDYTQAEREMIKSWANKAKAKNDEESEDTKFVWRVRGNPKSGLRLKKFPKKPTNNQ